MKFVTSHLFNNKFHFEMDREAVRQIQRWAGVNPVQMAALRGAWRFADTEFARKHLPVLWTTKRLVSGAYRRITGSGNHSKKMARRYGSKKRSRGKSHSGKPFSWTKGKHYNKKRSAKKSRFQRARKRRALLRPYGIRADLMKIHKQIRALQRANAADTAQHIHRRRDTYRVNASANQNSMSSADVITPARIEGALANVTFYSPATGTFTAYDPAVGTSQKSFMVQVSTKVTIRNNYDVPADLRLFYLECKSDTSINAATAYSNGLADQGNPGAYSSLVYLTDSDQFTSLWKMSKSCYKRLEPGDECVVSYATPWFKYDTSLVDSQTETYIKKYHSAAWALQVRGVLGHDVTVTTEEGFLPASVDVCTDATYHFKYDGGADMKNYSVDDNSNAFTNNGVTGMKPTSNNQIWSSS